MPFANRALAYLFALCTLCACTTSPIDLKREGILHDDLFSQPSKPIDANEIFALSNEMQAFLQSDLRKDVLNKGLKQGLYEALGRRSQMRIEYDAAYTKTASETFRTRSGNCLSLVIMTAAFAKNMGIAVNYQDVYTDELWSRMGDLQFSTGHVNIVLGKRLESFSGLRVGRDFSNEESLIVDFQPSSDLQQQQATPIGEQRIVAMFMNNRAAELLSQHDNNAAYWHAREALLHDPDFMSALNTLGVVYQQNGNLAEAEAVFRRALAQDGKNTNAMHNLIAVLNKQERKQEAQLLAAELQRIQPRPPFYFLNLGIEAMNKADYRAAKNLFNKELARNPHYHEVHFWMASAHAKLGEVKEAQEQLQLAKENSLTRIQEDIYSAKLEKIKSTSLR